MAVQNSFPLQNWFFLLCSPSRMAFLSAVTLFPLKKMSNSRQYFALEPNSTSPYRDIRVNSLPRVFPETDDEESPSRHNKEPTSCSTISSPNTYRRLDNNDNESETNGIQKNNQRVVHEYRHPPFCDRIHRHAPKYRLNLAIKPTPIHSFLLPQSMLQRQHDITLMIKRDDMSGGAEAGNKIRKLEFLLADAISSGHDSVITAGGIQSNHARAVSILSRRVGLKPHVFLRSASKNSQPDVNEILTNNGNLLVHRLVHAHIHMVPKMPFLTGLLPRMRQLQDTLREQDGSNAYIIGIGGSDAIGLWGYIDAFDEISKQIKLGLDITHITMATGSGGTLAGITIANYLCKQPVRVIAFSVSDIPDYFYDHVDDMLFNLGLHLHVKARDIVTVLDAKGKAYGVNTHDDFHAISHVAAHSGILLDPTYTLKAIRGLVKEINKGPVDGAFPSGSRILFIHTGGLLGLYDRRVEPFLDTSPTTVWDDAAQPV